MCDTMRIKMINSYRSIYEDHTNIDLPTWMQVHHIDMDRSNNRIINLVALPISLHQTYHNICNRIPDEAIINKLVSNSSTKPTEQTINFNIRDIEELNKMKYHINNFISFRDHILGFIWVPKFHECTDYTDVCNIVGWNND